MLKNKCTVLVNSCDKYEEVWNPFFTLLNRYWKDCEYQIFLNTETKPYTDFENVKVINTRKEISWSDRLKAVLCQIDSEYVILLLDDFFMMDKVDSSEIRRVMDIMDQNKDIATFYFKHSTGQKSDKIEYDRYIRMDHHKKYIFNFQAAIWRREVLLQLLAPGVTAWDIEEKAMYNGIDEKYCFYCPVNGSYTSCDGEVFPYLWALEAGYGICKSRWLWNNKKLFRREQISYTCRELKEMKHSEFLVEKFKNKLKNKLKSIVGNMKNE